MPSVLHISKMFSSVWQQHTKVNIFEEIFSFIRMSSHLAPKIITINSLPIAITCRVVQLLILMYAFAYILWYKRGYQDRDSSLLSSVTLEANGIGVYTKDRIMTVDNADYIVPPEENNALFIMTNYIETDQQRGFCAESTDIRDSSCKQDLECEKKRKNRVIWNGRWTGKCRQPEGQIGRAHV